MSGIKKLAGQTLWYGVPRIFSRFLSFGISLLGFQLFDPNGSAPYTQIYAVIPFLNVVFTYGLETSYFRFAQTHDRTKLYNTLTVSIIVSTFLLTALLFLFKGSLTDFLEMHDHPEYITWMIWITFFDTLGVLPLAKLRLEERPRKYAIINMASVLFTVLFVLFFYYIAQPAHKTDPNSFPGNLFDPKVGIGYMILANIFGSVLSLLLLYKEFISFKFVFDKKLWKEVMTYSYPLLIVGFGGMINEMISRVIYPKVLDISPRQEEFELGVFGANYKLAVLITIFIQIFRMAAEPFFFNQSKNEGAQKMYARVMKFFVIACCFMFLVVALFLDGWSYLIAARHPEYKQGIHIVPIISMASVFLGIYYNLSVWYKLTNKNMAGAMITIAGAVITIVLNILLIRWFHYTGAAWATFLCYLFMMISSYQLGQKYYPIPYAKKKLITYLVIVSLMYIIHEVIVRALLNFTTDKSTLYLSIYYFTAFVFLALFTLLILKVERRELINMPVIGKFVAKIA